MRRVAVLWLVLAAWGCSNDEGPSASELWCGAVCFAVSRCTRADASACSSSCQSERPELADISVEGAGPLAECLKGMSCQALFDEEQWSAAYGACWDRAKPAVEVTPDVRAFCEAYTLAEFECRYWYATDACERDYGMWSEGVRERVAACTAQPSCDQADACITAVFEGR